MDRGTALYPAYSTGGFAQSIRDAFVEVASLFFGNATFTPHRSFEGELRAVAEPHLAILVHKRSRLLSPDSSGNVRPERWAKELDDFVGRTLFWPVPATTEAFGKWDRRQIVEMLDGIVAAEQRRELAAREALPSTSRFDSSWAD